MQSLSSPQLSSGALPVMQLMLGYHHKTEKIFIDFAYNSKLIHAVNQVPGARYSNSKKSWHMPVVRELVAILGQKVSGLGELDTRKLRVQLLERKTSPAKKPSYTQKPEYESLCTENQEALHLYEQMMVLKNLAASTKKNLLKRILSVPKSIK